MATTLPADHSVSRHDFANQRRPRVAIELLAAGVAVAIVVTLVVALNRAGIPSSAPAHQAPVASASPEPSAPTTSHTPLQGPALRLRISARLNLAPRQVTALAVSPGILWAATQGVIYGEAGRLIRIDASTTRQTASWVIGGDPVAVSAAGADVWVANNFGDGSKVLPDQNTVVQLNAATGAVVHVYDINDPRAIVATGDVALVASAGTQNGLTEFRRLASGQTSVVATVPGTVQGPAISSQSAMTVCGNDVYFGLSNLAANGAQSVTLYAMARTGGAARTLASIPNEWWPTVTCDTTSMIAVDGGGDAPVSVNLATNTSTVLSEGSGAAAISFMSGLVWELYESTAATGPLGYLTALDPSTGLESSSRLSIPGTDSSELYLIAPAPAGLWVIGGAESLILHVTFG